MKPSSALWAPLLAVAVGTVACGPPTPPEEPVTEPSATPTGTKPPPPPKCESLEESCKAKADSSARIGDSGYRFRPPKGWFYAQLDKATIAETGPEGAAIVIGTMPTEKNEQAFLKARAAKLTELAELAKLQVPAKMLPLGTPKDAAHTPEVAGLKWLYWEREVAAKRGKAESGLFIFSAKLDGAELFGFGFAPGTVESDDDKLIMQALESIEKDDGASLHGEKASGGADKKGGSTEGSKDKAP